jgi:dTMP kinase
VHSTIAYQGYGYEGRKGGPTQKQIQAVNLIATKDVMPDLTILLDMEPEEALKRIAALKPELSVGESAGQEGRVDKEGRQR